MSATTLRMRWAYSLAGAKRFPVTGRRHPLEKQASRHMIIGAATSITIGLSAFLFWQWMMHRTPDETGDREVAIVRYTELGVPPSIDRPASSQVNMAQQVAMAAPPQIAVPEPVPDELAVDQTIMTVAEVNSALTAATNTNLDGLGEVQVGDDLGNQSKEAEFKQSVNVMPVILQKPKVIYPDMARMAGIEGVVTVEVRVGKNGRVTKTRVKGGPVPLHAAAIAAAMTAVFQPATTDGRPVEVWVAIPIKFTLHN